MGFGLSTSWVGRRIVSPEVRDIGQSARPAGQGRFWQVFCALGAMWLSVIPLRAGDDPAALTRIFGEQHVAGTALDVHRAVARLTPWERYEHLTRWLLPSDEHRTLRVEAAFAPTDPGPITLDSNQVNSPFRRHSEDVGGILVSPVIDLVEAAQESDQLDDLLQRVAIIDPQECESDSIIEVELGQQVLLALIELERGRSERAVAYVERVMQLAFPADLPAVAAVDGENALSEKKPAAQVPEVLFEPRDSVLILLARIIDVPELQELAGMILARYEPWMRDAYEPGARQRHVMALANYLRGLGEARVAGATLRPAVDSGQWDAVSRMTAESRGSGCPNPAWMIRPGHAELIVPHERDFLYYRVPLSGNFDVECDVAVSSWSVVSLMVAGRWLGPAFTQSAFDSGVFRWQAPRENFEPALTRVRHWLHYRATVRDGVVTTYFNGRPIHTRSVPPHRDPWVAIRCNPRDRGTVRDLRITGEPVIPDEIKLSNDVGLGQWYAYYGEEVGDVGDHWVILDGVLHGARDGIPLVLDSLAWKGSDDSITSTGWDERLLRYHRPMLEDGVISYEFFYEPGAVHVHPALDRLAFLLSPTGVRLHQLTDGNHDFSGLSPANIIDEPEHRRGPAELPLRVSDWNHVNIGVAGDEMFLVLNDVEVWRRPLAPGNRRSFGLFHFADQTEARVRNIVWKGNWPRQIPSVAEQALASQNPVELDSPPNPLQATFEHNFGEDGLSVERFTVLRGSLGQELQVAPEGVWASRAGTGGYQGATIAPSLMVHGDFDVEAEFSDFFTSNETKGTGTVSLMLVLDNSSQDEHYLLRRYTPSGGVNMASKIQCCYVKHVPEGERRSYFATEPTEELSGRMRFSRRGDQLYFLTAEGDSPNWRLRGSQPVPSNPIAMGGVRLLLQIHDQGGEARVLWKRLQVRAESLSGPAFGAEDNRLAQLNAERDALPQKFRQDFRQQPPTPERFIQWNHQTQWRPNKRGWQFLSQGKDEWSATGTATYAQVAGDFDVSVVFEPLQLATPKSGKQTQIYLQIEGSDPLRTQVNSMFNLMPNGETLASAQSRETRPDGSINYRSLGQLGMKDARRLRLCRRGSTVTFLAAASKGSEDQIICRYEFNAEPIDTRSIRFMVRTGGEGLESDVYLESIEIRAAEITNQELPVAMPLTSPGPPAMNRNPPGSSRSWIDQVLDLLR